MDENTFTQGCAATVRADGDLTFRESGAIAVVAGGDAAFTQAGAGFFVAGGNVTIEQSGAGNMFIGGSVEMRESRVGQMVAVEADVTDSKVGLLIGGKVALEHSQVLLTTVQAAALGVAAGGAIFLLTGLFRRR